ncbi:MAG: OmpA family protein [Steroidobacteraceae bacterium]
MSETSNRPGKRASGLSACIGMLLANLALAQSADVLPPLQSSLEQAKTARAELLAPRTYVKASDALKDLTKDVSGNAKADRIQKKRTETQQAIDKTQQVVAQSNKTLLTVIKAYDDAVTAGAPKSQGEAWSKAEQRFKQAVSEVEGNDLDDARSKGAEAEVLLRDVELQAIKVNILGEARDVIGKAQVAKVPEFAPRSFAVAQQQLALADQQLARNRYELTEPKRLAAQAAYEARHAQYLAELIGRAQAKDGVKQQVAEEQLLAIEDPIRQLVTELEVAPTFDQGYSSALQQARAKVQQQQQDLINARQSVRDREQQIADLKGQLTDTNAAIQKLETRLGGESEERQALLKRLSAQERLRDNISQVEKLFTAEEGRVYRQGNQMVMSLNAIAFRSAKSTIEPSSFPVLAKVDTAMKLFPTASLVIEGHTDSEGSDSANLLLSQDRADAVRQYLISNLGVNAEKVSSVGYGESKPIASNETESGRARNRRIDIVMDIGAQ